jgi:hypothetical protein
MEMQSKYIIWILAVFFLLCIMLFCNRKVRLWSLLIEQIRVFRNDKKKKISLWDCICFLVFPMVISLIFVYKLGFTINNNLAELLTTVFSIVFTVLFGFAAIMISKIDSQNKTEKQVAEETFVSIVSSTILSLIAAVLSIVLTQVKSVICLQIISSGVITISLIIIMLLLLITKRVFLLYVDRKN